MLITDSKWAIIALMLSAMALFGLLLYIATQEWRRAEQQILIQKIAQAEVAKTEQVAAVAKTQALLATSDVAQIREDLRVAGIQLSRN